MNLYNKNELARYYAEEALKDPDYLLSQYSKFEEEKRASKKEKIPVFENDY